MKKFIAVFLGLLFSWSVQAAPPVAEAPIKSVGTPVTIAISSTTLTKVPSSQTSGRFGIFISNPPSNITAVEGFYGDCTSTALANTIRPIHITVSSTTTQGSYYSMREDICLWLLSLNTAAASQNIHYQEVSQ